MDDENKEQMEVVEALPPNWMVIERIFPYCEKHKAIFCYGNKVYNPFKREITPNLLEHEAVHMKQQASNPDLWWHQYCSDPVFRFLEEVEAYGAEYKFVKDRAPSWVSDRFLDGCADSLAGEQYGGVAEFAVARSKIRNYAKSL